MKCLELQKNFYFVGVIDHNLKVFDVAVLTEYGSSYNSYLLKTKEGVIVFDGSKAAFTDEYIAHLKTVIPLDQIKYLVVAHTEPDHSGAIEKLLHLNPNIVVVASFGALTNLSNIIRKPFNKLQMIPDGEMMVGGYTLHFVSGLLLHWPDVMFTYIKELKTLISCDAFGAHFASDAILLSKEPDKIGYQKALEYYFINIMGPFGSYVTQACDRVEKLDIKMICPGHGPVVDEDIKGQIATYRRLAKQLTPINDLGNVTIVFSSAYGYTRAMAEYLRDNFLKAGKTVFYYEISVLNYEKVRPEIIKHIYSSGLVLLGSPTIVGDAICFFYDLLSHLYWTIGQGKKASAFGDFGWSGEAVNNLSERLGQLRFTVIPGFRWTFRMDEKGQKELAEYFARLSK
jgi:flavorubredoxin